MRVTVYDKNPGPGVDQWFLKMTWLIGCWLQKLFGAVDEYKGVSSWEEAHQWLMSLNQIESLQYWGHGSPGAVWISQKLITAKQWASLRDRMMPSSLIWFRTCSTFQGLKGITYAKEVANGLGCTAAGHTRIIGPLQGGLHTIGPNAPATWPIAEGEFPTSWWPPHLRWGNNTITFLATKIPKGW